LGVLKSCIPTSQKIHYVFITKCKLLVLFCELIGDLCDNFCTNWKRVFSFTPWPLYPMEGTPGAHGIGSWVGAKAGLDMWEKKRTLTPAVNLNPDGLARSLIIIPISRFQFHLLTPYLFHGAEPFFRS
jgi:hypothetical protein